MRAGCCQPASRDPRKVLGPRFSLKGSFKGDIEIDVIVECRHVEVDVDMDRCFGCLRAVSKIYHRVARGELLKNIRGLWAPNSDAGLWVLMKGRVGVWGSSAEGAPIDRMN